MNMKAFSAVNKVRCESNKGFNHGLHDWSRSDWMVATLGELGEAANVVKKLNRYRDNIPGNKENPVELKTRLAQEIADTFIYLDLFAQSEGFDLADIVADTFDAKSKEIGSALRAPRYE